MQRKATNEPKHVGAQSKFDKGVQSVGVRAAKPKPVPPKKKPVVTFTVEAFIHGFKNDILVTWKGYPLKEATREPKSKLKQDLGEALFAAELAGLRKNKADRAAQYAKWKTSV